MYEGLEKLAMTQSQKNYAIGSGAGVAGAGALGAGALWGLPALARKSGTSAKKWARGTRGLDTWVGNQVDKLSKHLGSTNKAKAAILGAALLLGGGIGAGSAALINRRNRQR